MGDDLECEEKFHDHDKMCAMTVILNEIEVMTQLVKTSPEADKSFYEDKKENLEFLKKTLETNISVGIITEEKYLHNLKNYLAFQEKLLASISKVDPKNKHYKRIVNRIELVKTEIRDAENPP